MRGLTALYEDQLCQEYGFTVPDMNRLVETTQWVIEDLGIAPDNDDAVLVITQGISAGYELGWHEGLWDALD